MSYEFLFKKPKFRNSCKFYEVENGVHIKSFGDEFAIANEELNKKDVLEFIELVNGENSVDEIINGVCSWDSDDVFDLLISLDQISLLTEGNDPYFKNSGLELMTLCEDLYRYLVNQHEPTRLTKAISSGKADLRLLYGFAFEYYHVTFRAQDSITPSMMHSLNTKAKELIYEFFVEEYKHDEFLKKALLSAGFKEEDIIQSVPLPCTAALNNMLTAYSLNDPLSYMAVLFMFEGSPYIEDAYIIDLRKYLDRVPEDFIKYQKIHSDINIQEEHGLMSRNLFNTIEYITKEERHRVLKSVRNSFYCLRNWGEQIFEYYSNETNPFPRFL